jgi:hypothetical protein
MNVDWVKMVAGLARDRGLGQSPAGLGPASRPCQQGQVLLLLRRADTRRTDDVMIIVELEL